LPLAIISLGFYDPTLQSVMSFCDVPLCDIIKVDIQLTSYGGNVPQTVAKLFLYFECIEHTDTIARGNVFVPPELLYFLGDFSGFSNKTEGWVNKIVILSGVGYCGQGLILIEGHSFSPGSL
jgi:hypothetical protein